MRIQVLVRLKQGVLDVQGKAVEHSLQAVGFEDVANVRVGRLIELDVQASDFETAAKRVSELCTKLLINPIIENFEIKPVES